MDITTITLDKTVKKKLELMRRYDRETFNEIIDRLISKKEDNDSETIEILSDPEIMNSLAKSLTNLKKGKLYSIEEV